jgi:uncharacterized coiled-coil DUF342 family protein
VTQEEELAARREVILGQLAPLEAEKASILSQMQPLRERLDVLNEKIGAIKRPELAEIERRLGPKGA